MSPKPEAPPKAGTIPLCVSHIAGREWEYVKACLDLGRVSSVGSFVDRFEREFAEQLQSPHAVATMNGTAALHTALLVAGVEPGDEVLMSDLTFIAPANAVRYVGAFPVFIDAAEASWQMNVELVREFLEERCERRERRTWNRVTGRRVSAILPVHILGHPVEMEAVVRLARDFELAVIEDASQSLGGTRGGRPLGTMGDIGCFSFNGNKLVTTGAGGMLVTARAGWAERARYLITQAKDDPVEYLHRSVGFNYRMSNLQASIGCAQLELLDRFLQRKRDLAGRYLNALAEVPGILPLKEVVPGESAYWLSAVLVREAEYGRTCRELMNHLASQGIQTRPLWTPLHRNPCFERMLQPFQCPVAEVLHRDALTLPSSVGLTDADQERVISVIRAAGHHGGLKR